MRGCCLRLWLTLLIGRVRAVGITKIEKQPDGSRWVTGLFSTTVLKTQSNGDGPENRDYVISDGQFRLHVPASNSAAFDIAAAQN